MLEEPINTNREATTGRESVRKRTDEKSKRQMKGR